MSRSYKHSPVCCCGDADRRTEKRIANRRVRRRKGLLQFSAYKRLYERWMIVEDRFYCTPQKHLVDAVEFCNRYGESFDAEEVRLHWNKYYRWK